MSQQPPQPHHAPPQKTLTIKELSKKLEISSIDFSESVREAVAREGKAPFLIFDKFASRINFFDDKVSMRMRAFDKRISDAERKLYENCKKQLAKHKIKLAALFSDNLKQRSREMKQATINSDMTDWVQTIKAFREVFVTAQQIAKRGGIADNSQYIDALKKFEQQVEKIILAKCVHIITQNENVQANLTEQYTHINALPLSNQAREDLKEEINKNYRKAFNENFKPG